MVTTRSQRTREDVRSHPQNASDSDPEASGGENAQHQRLIAKATVTHKAANLAELSFFAGDEIYDIKQIGPNLWRGTHRATGRNGMFHKDHVNFLLETTEVGLDQDPVAHESPRQNIVPTGQIILPPPADFRREAATSANKNDSQNYASAILMAVIAVALMLYFTFGPLGLGNSGGIRVNISDLKTHFSSQEPDMWDTLRAGLMSSRTEGVQTFLFLHNSPGTATCFIRKLLENNCIAYKASDISNSESFVSDLKMKLLAHKCLVMFDLEDLHPDGVAVLKGFCDAYEPIVPKSKFFFALNAAGSQLDADAKKLARTLLETKWLKDFTHDDFGGTLTRLTQNVLKIRNEPNLSCK